MKRLLLTLPCERVKLNGVSVGTCELELYEYIEQLPYMLKSYHAKVVIDGKCLEWNRNAERFELSADIQRKDGVFEVLHFTNLQPVEIELGGKWVFDMQEPPEKIRHLLEL